MSELTVHHCTTFMDQRMKWAFIKQQILKKVAECEHFLTTQCSSYLGHTQHLECLNFLNQTGWSQCIHGPHGFGLDFPLSLALSETHKTLSQWSSKPISISLLRGGGLFRAIHWNLELRFKAESPFNLPTKNAKMKHHTSLTFSLKSSSSKKKRR